MLTLFFTFVVMPVITNLTALNASYNEGSHVNISCEATGKPDPEVLWIKSAKKMQECTHAGPTTPQESRQNY